MQLLTSSEGEVGRFRNGKIVCSGGAVRVAGRSFPVSKTNPRKNGNSRGPDVEWKPRGHRNGAPRTVVGEGAVLEKRQKKHREAFSLSILTLTVCVSVTLTSNQSHFERQKLRSNLGLASIYATYICTESETRHPNGRAIR